MLLLVPSPTPPIIAVLTVQQGWRNISALDLWKRVTLICISWLLLLLQVLSFTFHRHHWDHTGSLSRYCHQTHNPLLSNRQGGKSYGGEESQWNRRSLICMCHQVAVPSAGAISNTTAISPPYPYTIVWDEFVNIFTPPKSQTVRSKERK